MSDARPRPSRHRRLVALVVVAASCAGTPIAIGAAGSEAAAQTDRSASIVGHHRRHRCTGACAHLNIGLGPGATTSCGPPQLVGADSSATPARRFTFSTGYPTPPGDLLVAAVVTDGQGVVAPRGWARVPGGDTVTAGGTRLQIFSRIPVAADATEPGAQMYTFMAASPQMISGELVEMTGAQQTQPVDAAAGEVASTPSPTVTAPALVPPVRDVRLLFIGAVGSAVKWSGPPGMTALALTRGSPGSARVRLAYQWWRSASFTGSRTAEISSALPGIGDLVAVSYPPPVACPSVRIASRRQRARGAGHRPVILLRARDEQHVSVRLRCDWSATCRGALALATFAGHSVVKAASPFRIPAGHTRTVTLALCSRALVCAGGGQPLRGVRHATLELDTDLVLRLPNGQYADIPFPGDSAHPGGLYLKTP